MFQESATGIHIPCTVYASVVVCISCQPVLAADPQIILSPSSSFAPARCLPPRFHHPLYSQNNNQLECGPMPNVMVALPNIGGALCSTPQSLADAYY